MGKLVVQELFRVAQGLLVGNAQMLAVFLQLAAARTARSITTNKEFCL